MFYEDVKSKLPVLANINANVMRHKMRYLKSKYLKAIQWKSQTGAGVLETEGEQYVADYLENMCPYFNNLHNIFGSRKNVNIPIVFNSTDNVDTMLSCIEAQPENDWIELIESVETQGVQEDYSSYLMSQPYNGESLPEGLNIELPENSTVEPAVVHTLDEQDPEGSASGISFGQPRAVKKRKVSEKTPIHAVLDLQSERLELEKKKFEWQMSKEKHELNMKNVQLQQQLEIKKMELEMEERVRKHAEELKAANDLKKFEIELQCKQVSRLESKPLPTYLFKLFCFF